MSIGHRHDFQAFLDDEAIRARLSDELNSAFVDSEDGAPDLDGVLQDVLNDVVFELRDLAEDVRRRVRTRDKGVRARALDELADWIEAAS